MTSTASGTTPSLQRWFNLIELINDSPLGTNQAVTPMGAIEVLSMEIKDGFSLLASAISDLKVD
jgi:hypothetical protein